MQLCSYLMYLLSLINIFLPSLSVFFLYLPFLYSHFPFLSFPFLPFSSPSLCHKKSDPLSFCQACVDLCCYISCGYFKWHFCPVIFPVLSKCFWSFLIFCYFLLFSVVISCILLISAITSVHYIY